MRRTRIVCRTGLPLVAAAVLVTACGGSGDKSASSSSSAARSTAAESSAAAEAAGSDFCAKAANIESTVDAAVGDLSDPSSIPQAMQTAAAQIRAIEPPAAIASDWAALADGVDKLAATFANIDLKDPNALATLEQQAGQLAAAGANIQKYLADKCGIGTAAPSS